MSANPREYKRDAASLLTICAKFLPMQSLGGWVKGLNLDVCGLYARSPSPCHT